eukprot:TRINITY_DN415_c0_g1_i1.p1 TRINITY_DN415_c0_g1~~TRINITY_DN415_c0_g1_i1.p1  ORF type:complete len:862 (+),score=177.61 TRINITY_DN415_c0_g1_i1:77-2662(+)
MYMQIQRHDDVRVPIVVMDWMMGDSSRAPLSRQKTSPSHYEQVVFPRVREEFRRMSYGKFDIHFTVIPEVVRYTRPRTRYMAEGYPFPGLYNGAKESLAGDAVHGSKYNFDDYDLVYVVAPQQAPVSTKGVAWVGAKGAMCNGCEEISENFQVMVAVHELGHNLGLSHASSSSLEYGNVFDWMGNYPDVQGLSYGLGYKLKLHWLPSAAVAEVSEQALATLNDEYLLRPFDIDTPPRNGELVGIRFQVHGDARDLYVAFRDTAEGQQKSGVYLTWQDKDKPNSELVDAACHSPSQRDARLQAGWTYMDPSGQLAIHVVSVDQQVATVRAFKVENRAAAGAIRARKTFTDGKYKCPRTCQDADLLVSQYKGCAALAGSGYCEGGSITMGSQKMRIDTDLCPQSCDKCEDVLKNVAPGSAGGCSDRNIKISGMNCRQSAARGYCDYNTNIGNIGQDLCPRSCGKCPPPPAPAFSQTAFQNPTPVRSHGRRPLAPKQEAEQPTLPPDPPPLPTLPDASGTDDPADSRTLPDDDTRTLPEENSSAASTTSVAPGGGGSSSVFCTDDPVWQDKDGDGCATYAQYIAEGRLPKEAACSYNDGAAKAHCRKTCDSCTLDTYTCQDRECVTNWKVNFGKCWGCEGFQNMCEVDPHYAMDCPRTCGRCKAPAALNDTAPVISRLVEYQTTPTTTTTSLEVMTDPPPCRDRDCVESWMQTTGKCYKCHEWADEYCGRDKAFMASCPLTCKQCSPNQKSASICGDDFKPHVCKRFVSWGWCGYPHVSSHCKVACGFCQGLPHQFHRQSQNADAATASRNTSDGHSVHAPPVADSKPASKEAVPWYRRPVFVTMVIIVLVAAGLYYASIKLQG